MITCPKCHAQLEDDAKFCDTCGTPIEAPAAPIAATAYCPHCGQQNDAENQFCQNCGKPLNETETKKNKKQDKTDAPEMKKSKKGFVFAGIGVAAVVLIAVAAFILFGGSSGGSSKNYAMYVKDKELYYNGFSRNDPWQVTSRFIDGDGFDNYELASGAYSIGAACTLSKDGSLLFFPDRVSYFNNGYSLYYRKVNNTKEEAVKIDSDITSYSVNEDASAITYQKNDTIYQYNRKKDDKQKIAGDIENYYVSDDGRTILYMTTEDVLYITVKGGERNKIDSDVASLNYVSEDLSTIFYIKDGTLYKKEDGKEKEKISSDVSDVITAYDSGEVYYIKADKEELSLMDFVIDDKKESDAALLEPTYPGRSASNAEQQAYNAAMEEYYAKQERDDIRDELASESMPWTTYTLCYYDGKEESIVSDAFTYSSYACAVDKPVITYMVHNLSEDINVKMSDAEYPYEILDIIYGTIEELSDSAGERYVAVGGTSALLDQEEASDFNISPDGKTLYYLDEVPEDKNYGELYQVSISSSGELGAAELYDSDVCANYFYFIGEDALLYFKDYKDGKGELYINQEKIDYDVSTYNINYDEDHKTVTYFTDWNIDKGYGTLKSYTKNESEKIADDVHSYFVLPSGNVLYLYDYSQKYYHGDLYLWSGKDAEKIDDGVVCILPVS